MSVPSLTTPEGRRFWSFIVILGGCFIFTMFAAVGVWLVSGNAWYSLILALAAHAQLFVGMGAFSYVLGRRMTIEAGKNGMKFGDTESIEHAIQAPVDAAQHVADEIKREVTSGDKP